MKAYCFGIQLLLALVFFRECSAPAENSNPPAANKQAANTEPGAVCAVEEINYRPTLMRDAAWLKEAWKKFIADGRYCIPAAGQFKIPEAAKKDSASRSDLEGSVKHPYGWNDFNQDLLNEDFTAIIIDKSQSPPSNFGLVIFHEPKAGKAAAQPFWVFKNQDLSKSIITGGSGMFIISTYADDGTSKGCFVNWNSKQETYSCDAEYVPAKR